MNNTASTQGDTISRSALKKALKSESYWTYTHEYGDAIPVGWVMSAIDNAPTVEPSQNAEHDATQYSTGYQDGFLEAKKLFTDPENTAVLEKITAEIVSILRDVMPQVIGIAKEHATGNGMKEGQTDE